MVMLAKIKNDITNRVFYQEDKIKKVLKHISNLTTKEVVSEYQIIGLQM